MKIAILGFGVVGSGCYESLQGSQAEVKKILDLRDFPGMEGLLTKDINEILNDDEIETVAELMGGESPAYDYVKASLLKGKNVVTANKQMLSKHFSELMQLAADNKVRLEYSATSGGGIPWIYCLKRTSALDEIIEIGGVMNGTTNFILDAMQREGSGFDEALKKAQELGYAEKDPTADIEGLDVRAKLAISCNTAFGGQLNPESIPTRGISGITKEDIDKAKAEGKVIRLVGKAVTENGNIKASIGPEEVDASSPLYNLRGPENMFYLVGKKSGLLAFKGAGAGKYPTGMNVAEDVLSLIK